MRNKDRQILEHILRHCCEVLGTVQRFDNSEERFQSDYVFYNACSMSIFQIGELSKRMSDDFKQIHSELPWNEMRGVRNLFAHEYESVDKKTLWQTIQNDIPKLREQLRLILQSDVCNASGGDSH